VTAQPGVSGLDQCRECLAESLDPVANLLGVYVRGGVLQSSLEDVELVQQRRLGLGQSFIGGERLEDLFGVRAPVGEQADQARSRAGSML
jgi:hypothetical protein